MTNPQQQATPKELKVPTMMASFLLYGVFPEDFTFSIMILIVKTKRNSRYRSSNYQGIALRSICVWKLFDHYWANSKESICIFRFTVWFQKQNLMFLNTVHGKWGNTTYFNGDRVINVILHDSSKAFDRVNCVILFKTSLLTVICHLVARMMTGLCLY